MQPHDLSCKPSVGNPISDPPTTMSDPQPSSSSSPIHSKNHQQNHTHNEYKENNSNSNSNANNSSNNIVRRERPARECTKRAAARLQAAAAAEAEAAKAERKKKAGIRKNRLVARLLREHEDEDEDEDEKKSRDSEDEEEGEDGSPSLSRQQCSRILTPLVGEPEQSQLPRWELRSMWQLASVLNFLNVFRHLLNVKVEFSAEEFETALITPNKTLGDIHMPLLKAIPPVTRMALGHNTWITVLCRKLRDWWHWVAEGELPIVASHGAEIEAYNALDPATRVVILKALCDIRVEQEDIRNYIDDSLKQGFHLSLFRKERCGGDSHGISYWYEDDPIIGHRLYREIRKVEVKKGKGKNVQLVPNSGYQWETVATNWDEFQDVSEKLFSSKNRTEASVGKKLKNNMLPEIEKIHKRKEKLLKKQHRQALMLDNMLNMDGLGAGRSLRDRKPVTYTFDDYDRSINEAIKITKKKQSSPEPTLRREAVVKHENSTNGRWGSPDSPQHVSFRIHSPKSPEFDEYEDDEYDEDQKDELLDRSDRRRQRPQRYSAKEFVEAISENEADFDSDDDIEGEAVYDEEYLKKRKKQRKMSSSSEGDDEYHWDDGVPEDEDEADSPSASEESDEPRRSRKLPGRTRRETKLRSVGELRSGLRRSKRATRNSVNYSQYELSDSEAEPTKPGKSNGSDEHYDACDNAEFSMGSEGTEENNDNEEMKVEQPVDAPSEMATEEKNNVAEKPNVADQDDVEGGQKRRFLDLNELAPGSGFDDGPNSEMKDDADDF